MFGQNLVPNRVRPIRVCRPRHTETCKRLRPIKRHGWLSALTRLVKSFFCGLGSGGIGGRGGRWRDEIGFKGLKSPRRT
jgi:hypothetical protein